MARNRLFRSFRYRKNEDSERTGVHIEARLPSFPARRADFSPLPLFICGLFSVAVFLPQTLAAQETAEAKKVDDVQETAEARKAPDVRKTTEAKKTTNAQETAEKATPELVAYQVVDFGIPDSLTGKPGDPDKGRALAIQRKKGNCLACHAMPIPEEEDHGNTGPDLAQVASRLTVPLLRLRVVDPKRVNPETMMQAFYKIDGLHRVAKKFQGKPILTAEEVEDVVAYLATLQ
uniref:Sulfur oxidation c-type cytochrome SoxX n=1 Tax=Candidatus Kentrum sp. DK TaxID=2126562 RepID=A0A450TK26_9GAMM|nr:MAG: sulfur oxidation c-type cytochrome SoxX [Candidatus Kentron sp. DK]